MNPVSRIKELTEQCGWSKYRLAKEANLSQSTISNMTKRGNSPTIETIEKCCNAFGISLRDFFGKEVPQIEYTLEERRLIEGVRELSLPMRSVVYALVETAAADTNSKKPE